MLLRSLVVVGLVGLSIAYSVATAEDAGSLTSPNSYAVSGVSFNDIGANEGQPTFALNVAPETTDHYPRSDLANTDGLTPGRSNDDTRQMEVALTGAHVGGSPLDVSYSQRASVGFNSNGDLDRSSHGHEVRLGRRIGDRLQSALGLREIHGRNSWDNPTWYFFASSDDSTVSFRGGRLTLQDQVDVGDMQVGLTMERGPLQASIAYIERETTLQTWRKNYKFDQAFTGISVRWRH
jgi:hypothetical protein